MRAVAAGDVQAAGRVATRGAAKRGSSGALFKTSDGDETCLLDASKGGPDADESAGGCKYVLVAIDPAGQPAAAYHEVVA